MEVRAASMRQAAQHVGFTLYDFRRAAMPKPCDEADTTCIMVHRELVARHASCVSSSDLESTIENFDDANGFFEPALLSSLRKSPDTQSAPEAPPVVALACAVRILSY